MIALEPPRDPVSSLLGLRDVREHPRRAFRKNLEDMSLAANTAVGHRREDPINVLVLQILVEEIARGVHEDTTRLLPPKRVGNVLLDEDDLPGPSCWIPDR